MAEERRYQEDEVAEIFEAAASPASRSDVSGTAQASARGLTLAELQAIGREVGIPAERIAEAASALDRRGAPTRRRTQLGMPVAVGRTVDLPRAPTDREWRILVGELRETFHARGRESSQGDVRQWTNSNLHAMIEPTASGYRLRLGTLKGNALPVNAVGVGGIGMALFGLASPLLTGAAGDLPAVLSVGAIGAAAFVFNAIRLPRWARERAAQMEYIAERARALLAPAVVTDGDTDG